MRCIQEQKVFKSQLCLHKCGNLIQFQLIFLQDLFIAGAETTSSSLTSMILYMILYPEVQKRIQDEIDQVVGRYGFIECEVFVRGIQT